MRSLALVGLVVGLLAVTAVVSPSIATALQQAGFTFSFTRVYDRVFEVLLVLALIAVWRRLDLGGAAAIGLRHPRFARHLGRGLVIGVLGLLPGLLVGWLAGALVPDLRFPPGKTVWKAGLGLAGAVIVGVGEEALFRGVLLRRFVRDLGQVAGVLASTTIYAVVHALRTSGSKGPVDPWAGVERTLNLFAPLGEPTALPSVLGLFALGLLLAAARLGSGSLWVPIGIHAAWVAVFRVGRLFLDIRRWPVWAVGPGWPPLIGGTAGMIALLCTAGLLWWSRGGRRLGRARG